MNTIDEFCVKCQRKMRVAKKGQEVLELTAKDGRPYKLMSGDVLRCPECDYEIVSRFGEVMARHEKGFDERVRGLRGLGFGLLEVV